MKLNFSNEALGDADEGMMGHDGSMLMGGGVEAVLDDFPSLREFETSNLHTNKFMGNRAAHFAMQAIDQKKRD